MHSNSSPQSFIRLRRRLRNFRPWVAATIIVAMGLVAYYGTVGFAYWQTSRENSSLEERIHTLSVSLRRDPPNTESLSSELQESRKTLSSAQSSFETDTPDRLTAVLASKAQTANIELTSLAVGYPSFEVFDDIKYQAQILTLALRGGIDGMQQFLASIQKEFPAVAVSSIRITNLNSTPFAEVDLVFYSSPEKTSASADQAKSRSTSK